MRIICSCITLLKIFHIVYIDYTSGKSVLRTECSPSPKDLRVLQLCFYLCSPTSYWGGAAVRIWSVVPSGSWLQAIPPRIRSWTAEDELQILNCSHSPSPNAHSFLTTCINLLQTTVDTVIRGIKPKDVHKIYQTLNNFLSGQFSRCLCIWQTCATMVT